MYLHKYSIERDMDDMECKALISFCDKNLHHKKQFHEVYIFLGKTTKSPYFEENNFEVNIFRQYIPRGWNIKK